MGQAAAKVGSQFVGVCPLHIPPRVVTGIITVGSFDVKAEVVGHARVGDQGVGSCGHTTLVTGGSSTVKVDGRMAARVGDSVAGVISGIITSGANTVREG